MLNGAVHSHIRADLCVGVRRFAAGAIARTMGRNRHVSDGDDQSHWPRCGWKTLLKHRSNGCLG